jgi:hypothetical protein
MEHEARRLRANLTYYRRLIALAAVSTVLAAVGTALIRFSIEALN